jgi:hypothetical protein
MGISELDAKLPNMAFSGLGGGPCKKAESKRKPFSVSLVGSPTKPLTQTVGRYTQDFTVFIEGDVEMNRTGKLLFGMFLFVALSCNALSSSLPTSIPSTGTPKPSQIPTDTPAPTSTPVPTTSSLNFVASIGSNVQDVRFFESGLDAIALDQRGYATSFDTETARYINWELQLTYPAPGQRIDFIIHAICYKSDETMLYEQDLSSYVEADWTSSYHSLGRGSKDAGLWKQGTYTMVLSINQLEIARASFQVE